jgi:adenine-specific DNA-methyltransferase
MGSKRLLLQNGLGKLLLEESSRHTQFVDLFSGSCSVTHFVATKTTLNVTSIDLQAYSTVLAKAVTGRTRPYSVSHLEARWLTEANRMASKSRRVQEAVAMEIGLPQTRELVETSRLKAACLPDSWPIARSYGGHYFGLSQAFHLDFLLRHLPRSGISREICLAALIAAASCCAASPGHTAQPIQPTERGVRFIFDAWRRDPFAVARRFLRELAPLYGKKLGHAQRHDAVEYAEKVPRGSLVFVDPPYSSVQYSRFYHVLEAISRMEFGEVEGAGRYPAKSLRPQSSFSRKSESGEAISQLLSKLAGRQARVILTFPNDMASNGLSGPGILSVANAYYKLDRSYVKQSRLSTLGGNNESRASRSQTEELVAVLSPR